MTSSKPLNDVLARRRSPLDAFFTPRVIAVIGAAETPGSVGRMLFTNLTAGSFNGSVLPVNPRRQSILGHRAYPGVCALPEPVDLAIVATPAATMPEVIHECATAGV